MQGVVKKMSMNINERPWKTRMCLTLVQDGLSKLVENREIVK